MQNVGPKKKKKKKKKINRGTPTQQNIIQQKKKKRDELSSHRKMWMNLKGNMLGEISELEEILFQLYDFLELYSNDMIF